MPVATPVPEARQAAVRARVVRLAVPVSVAQAARVALEVRARMPRLGPRAMWVVPVVRVVRAAPPGPVGCEVSVVRAAPVALVAAEVSAVHPVGWALSVAPAVLVVMRVPVVRPAEGLVREEPLEASVRAAPAARVARAVRVLTALRASGR